MVDDAAAELVRVTDSIALEMRLAVRETVNHSAELVTLDARRRVQAAIGADQRMSRVTARMRNGKRSLVTAETIAKGGTRINPYYKTATSESNPVALIGVRGPAHLIEHKRRGGYQVRPRPAVAAGEIPTMADILSGTLGTDREQTAARLRHPALRTPQGPRAGAKPGPINNPLRPIGKAFDAAPHTIAQAARDELEAGLRRRLGASR
jgi:hypothetical protein